ncbi:MAG: glycosyltransferase [Verrucomicrobiales bacterium]|nr:glycosyltransferase [Verrucomicrobiales bacterium]
MISFNGSIHIWVPGIREGSGGIQAFSRVYVQAIREAFPWAVIRVFVKNDMPAEDDPLRAAGVMFHSVAQYPAWLRTPTLVLIGLSLGLWERPPAAITTHLHFLPALRMLHWLRGVKVMSVLHGIEAWDLRGGLRVRAMRAADHLMAVSHHTRKLVMDSYGITSDLVSVVPNTFDTERFTPGPKPEHLLQRYGLKPRQPVLLTVSRLSVSERYKGHRRVLRALDAIRREFPDVRYLVAGDGDELPRLRNEVKALGLQDCVILAGQVSGEELPDHYRLCDLFVMPSSREGFGIVFLEAMASGKPVVAGCLDGSVDALDGGRLGRLVDPNNSTEIAKAVCEVLAHQPPDALWHDPEALSKAVVEQFGYPRVSRLMADDLAGLLGREQVQEKASTDAPSGHVGSSPSVPRILVLTQLTSPYQVEFFNALSASPGCQLEVVYLTSRDRNRQWAMPDIAHEHVILSENPRLQEQALRSISHADLVVFNYYTDWFTLKAIRERASLRLPWVFWGERPGFRQTGVAGTVARWFLLKPLHRHATPIWAVGRFGVEGYQREFGRSRTYQNFPYFSELGRFQRIPRPPEAGRVFLYSGTFSSRKGCDLLAEVFQRVAARHPQARLVLVGSGELETQMRNVLQPCADRVTWLGFQNWDSLPECYALGTIFCFPSRYDGWGLSLVEALASGMPSIGTNRTGAALEFLEDGRAGWLVDAGSEQAFEDAMERALLLPEDEFKMMQTAARAAVAHNGLDEGVRRFTEASHDVLEHWRARMPSAPARSSAN